MSSSDKPCFTLPQGLGIYIAGAGEHDRSGTRPPILLVPRQNLLKSKLFFYPKAIISLLTYGQLGIFIMCLVRNSIVAP